MQGLALDTRQQSGEQPLRQAASAWSRAVTTVHLRYIWEAALPTCSKLGPCGLTHTRHCPASRDNHVEPSQGPFPRGSASFLHNNRLLAQSVEVLYIDNASGGGHAFTQAAGDGPWSAVQVWACKSRDGNLRWAPLTTLSGYHDRTVYSVDWSSSGAIASGVVHRMCCAWMRCSWSSTTHSVAYCTDSL